MKIYMRLFLMTVLVTISSIATFAQNANGDHQRLSREQLAEKQAQYIAGQVKMDKDKTARFVDTYCQYQKEVWALGPRQPRKANDGESEAHIKQRFERSQHILDLRQRYYEKYSKFLSASEIEQVYQLERHMMKRLANRGSNGRRGGHKR